MIKRISDLKMMKKWYQKIWEEARRRGEVLLLTNKKIVIQLVIIGCITAFINLIQPYMYMKLVNEVLIERDYSVMSWIMGGFVIEFFLRTLLNGRSTLLRNRIKNRAGYLIRMKLFKKVSEMKYEEYMTQPLGEMKKIIEDDLNDVSEYILLRFVDIRITIISIFVFCVSLVVINPILAMISLFYVPLTLYALKYFLRKIEPIAEQQRKLYGELDSFLYESFSHWKDCKMNNLEDVLFCRFEKMKGELITLFFKRTRLWYLYRTIVEMKDSFFMKMSLYLIGGMFVIYHQFSVGNLIAFINIYQQLFNNYFKLNHFFVTCTENKPKRQRVLEYLNKRQHFSSEVLGEGGEIQINNAWFAYRSTGNTIFAAMSMNIHKGEKVAVVGESGCGKSTLIKIIAGALPLKQGDIKINNQNIVNLPVQQITRIIRIVSQSPPILNLSIKDNLLLGNNNVPEKDLWRALELCCLKEFVECLPDKLESNVGEKGVKLSGGQKQRLAIARLMISCPPIAILDEATSEIDYESEKIILDNLFTMLHKSSIIVVSHRKTAQLFCDRVLVVDKGLVLEKEGVR